MKSHLRILQSPISNRKKLNVLISIMISIAMAFGAMTTFSSCGIFFQGTEMPTKNWKVDSAEVYFSHGTSSVLALKIGQYNGNVNAYFKSENFTEKVDFSSMLTMPGHDLTFRADSLGVLTFDINPALNIYEVADLVITFDTTTLFYEHSANEYGTYSNFKCSIITNLLKIDYNK